MGIPSFYGWLAYKYPKIVVKAVEENGELIDTSLPNPNKMEFDNLYLDMNGIIYQCFHPDDNDADDLSLRTSFDHVFKNMYEYTDHIFSIVRPRKLLYMAIDGVAPLAKTNRQRTSRLQNAKYHEIVEMEEDRLRKEFEMEGKRVLPKQDIKFSDKNVISPGTEFMFELSRKLQSYISSRMNRDPGWKDIKVILSDSNVPGEGEHKITSFIREQRMLPHYNPNTRHCIYGTDADLIMLALSTHEIHISMLRECWLTQEQSTGRFKDVETGDSLEDDKIITKKKKPYEFLHVWILREYLELDMKISDPPENFTFDLERIIDDFIFVSFFAGNDFLPRMPSLQVHERALDLLMTVYKGHFKSLGGYLVDMQRVDDPQNGFIKAERVEKFILKVGSFEEIIFKNRSELHERRLRRQREYAQEEEESESEDMDMRITSCSSLDHDALDSQDLMEENTKELKEKLDTCLMRYVYLALPDQVKLGTVDWRKRYYKEFFSAESPTHIESTRKEVVQKYTEGLLWVLLYYFSGVPSWSWYYPYHYGPLCSDLKGLAQVKVKFQKGLPLKPFDQLVAVLPPRSAHVLPKAYQVLMTEENSPLNDFYRTELEFDTDGMRFVWQEIRNVCFMNEERLLAETRKAEKELNNDEAQRNSENIDKLLVRRSNLSESLLLSLVSKLVSGRPQELVRTDTMSTGIGGSMRLCPEDFSDIDSTFENIWINIQGRNTLCVEFELPKGSLHIPRPLERIDFPPKTITEGDIRETHLWHEYRRNRNTRSEIQNKHGNSFHGNKRDVAPKWTPSSCKPIHKGAGTGRGFGRGRGNVSHEVRGFDNLNISESTEGSSRSYAKVQSVNNSFWPSRNVTTYNNQDNAWCQNAPFQANTPSQSGRGGQWDTTNSNYAWQHNTHLAASSSSQAPGTGRGDYATGSYTGPWRLSRDNDQNEFMGYHTRG